MPIADFARVSSRPEEQCIELIRDGTYTGINKDDKWFVSRDALDKGARTLKQEPHDDNTTLRKRVLLLLDWAAPVWSQRSDKSWCVFIRPGHGRHLVRPIGTKNWAAFFAALYSPPIWHIVTLTRHGLWLLLAWCVALFLFALVIGSLGYFLVNDLFVVAMFPVYIALQVTLIENLIPRRRLQMALGVRG